MIAGLKMFAVALVVSMCKISVDDGLNRQHSVSATSMVNMIQLQDGDTRIEGQCVPLTFQGDNDYEQYCTEQEPKVNAHTGYCIQCGRKKVFGVKQCGMYYGPVVDGELQMNVDVDGELKRWQDITRKCSRCCKYVPPQED